jgi:hypothetical protein
MSLDPKSRAFDPTYKPTKSLEQLVQEYPHIQFFRDMLGLQQDAIKEREAQLIAPHSEPEGHSDYAPWVNLANDPKVAPRARQYYQELIDGDRHRSALDRWKKALKHPSLGAGDKQYVRDQIDLLAQPEAGKYYSTDVVETVRRILAKLRRRA